MKSLIAYEPRLDESPEPTGAVLRVFPGGDKFAARRLRRCGVSGAIGSALR
jgi:hypothetical protein